MSSSIFHNAKNDRHYKAATGLSLAEFNRLYLAFAPCYTPKVPSPHLPDQRLILTDQREALFFILHYYKAYPTLQNMAVYFGISDASVSNYLAGLAPCLKAALQQQGHLVPRLFANQAAFDEAFQDVPALFIDVTEIPVERAKNQEIQREHYSGKKKFHTLEALVVSDANRTPLFVSNLYPGHVHDFTIFKDLFAGLDFSKTKVHVDSGFTGIRKVVHTHEVFLPAKASKNHPLTEEQKAQNQAFARVRVVVENALAKMKAFFVLRIENRMRHKEKLNQAVEMCVALVRFKMSGA